MSGDGMQTEDISDIKEIFRTMDTDGSGTVSMKELLDFLKAVSTDIDAEEVLEIFKQMDESGDRCIDFAEFKEVMSSLKQIGWERENKEASQISEEEIRKVFDIVDRDKSGSLSRREASRACKILGEKFGIEGVEEWLKQQDVDGDGVLSYAEFKMSVAGNLFIDI